MRFLPQYSYVVDINAVAAVVAVEDIAVNVLGLGVANDTDNSFVVAVLAFQDIFARKKTGNANFVIPRISWHIM